MKPQDEFGSSFETAKELPETSWKRKAIQAASSQAEPIRKSGGFQGSALPTPVELREKLEAFLLSLGVSDVGFSKPEAEGLAKRPMPLPWWFGCPTPLWMKSKESPL